MDTLRILPLASGRMKHLIALLLLSPGLASATGAICVDAHIPWQTQKRLLGKTFGGIYHEHLAGNVPRRPAWSWALIALGCGLSVLGYLRAWSGL
jgi:hypothetical protein